MRTINFDKEALKKLAKIDPVLRERIVCGIAGLLKSPPEGDIKQLQCELKGLSRLRVGSWRIVYEETDASVDVLAISSRGSAYMKGVRP